MRREDLGELMVLLAVAEERSFTRAAAKLGISQSSLSATIRRLESRLGIRLLTRTTRSVVPTEAGERLLEEIGPAFERVDAAIAALGQLRDRPAGNVRITATDHAIETVLVPSIGPLLVEHPDIHVEICVDYGLADIVADRFDAGVRLGEQVSADMVAVRIGPDISMAVVGTPDYFARHRPPETPQELTRHSCINIRLPTQGGLYAWEFERDGREVRVRVGGPLVFNSASQTVAAAMTGVGVGYVVEDLVRDHVASGRLVRILEEWCPAFPGYHLYYPSRCQPTPAFKLLVEALRHRR